MKYFFAVFTLLALVSQGSFVYAQSGGVTNVDPRGGGVTNVDPRGGGVTGADPVVIENPIEADSITELFQTLIDIVLIFAIPIIVFFIIYAGFLYVTARGNAGSIEKAHMALLYALIGGLLILGARVLIEVIQGTVDSIIK